MDGTRLQTVVSRGYAIAARNVGLAYDLYRPASPTDPLNIAGKVATVKAAFDSSPGFTFSKPSTHPTALVYGLFDRAIVQKGDILVGPSGPFHVVGDDHIVEPLCVKANRSVRVVRAETNSVCGLNDYSGATPDDETTLLANWPASILIGGKGVASHLQGAPASSGGYEVTMAAWVDLEINFGDVLIDDLERRYGVRAAELTDYGWRLMVVEMVV